MKQQLDLLQNKKQKLDHGGNTGDGKRKEARPLDRKKPMHVVLRSTRAKGARSFLAFHNQSWIRQLIYEKGRELGVKICDFANVGNHLHLKVIIHDRQSFQKFLRLVPSLIARKITGACRGNPQGKFWDKLAFTRVLKTRREELNLRGYIEANRIEAEFSYEAREEFLKAFRKRTANWGGFSTA